MQLLQRRWNFSRLPKAVSTLSGVEPQESENLMSTSHFGNSDVTHSAQFPPKRQKYTLKNITWTRGSLALGQV